MSFPCPECGASTNVCDSRPSVDKDGNAIIRRRACKAGHRFTTYEMLATVGKGRRSRGQTIVGLLNAKRSEASAAISALRDVRARIAEIEDRRALESTK